MSKDIRKSGAEIAQIEVVWNPSVALRNSKTRDRSAMPHGAPEQIGESNGNQ